MEARKLCELNFSLVGTFLEYEALSLSMVILLGVDWIKREFRGETLHMCYSKGFAGIKGGGSKMLVPLIDKQCVHRIMYIKGDEK